MPPMKPNIRVMIVLAAALVVAGVVFRQEMEMYRLRAVIAELTGLPREGAAISAVTNPLREDNAAARAWLEKAKLPAGIAERLLSAK